MQRSARHHLGSVTADINAVRKNGVGRAVGAVITQGWSLDTSDLRGDIYLTIVTGDEVFSLHTDSPTADNIAAVRRLEAVAATL